MAAHRKPFDPAEHKLSDQLGKSFSSELLLQLKHSNLFENTQESYQWKEMPPKEWIIGDLFSTPPDGDEILIDCEIKWDWGGGKWGGMTVDKINRGYDYPRRDIYWPWPDVHVLKRKEEKHPLARHSDVFLIIGGEGRREDAQRGQLNRTDLEKCVWIPRTAVMDCPTELVWCKNTHKWEDFWLVPSGSKEIKWYLREGNCWSQYDYDKKIKVAA